MNMCNNSQICTICLRNDAKLICSGELDVSKVKWSHKLSFCVPEIDWKDDILLCYECTYQLETAYLFRTLCLHSKGVHSAVASLQKIANNQSSGNEGVHSFDCNVCLKTCSTKEFPDHNPTTNHCRLCDLKFTTSIQLQSHNVQVHKLKCEIKCEKSALSLNQHISRTHERNVGDSKSNSTDTETLSENTLKVEKDSGLIIFNNFCSSKETDSPKNTSSELCNLTLDPVEIPAEGFKDEAKPSVARSKMRFTCEQCDYTFISSKKLIDHALIFHGFSASDVKPFACDKCDSKFTSSSNLVQHKKYHLGKRTHICTFCGKGFITKTDLNTHEKQHLNRREYQCVDCLKTFNTNKDLRSHRLVVHTDPSVWNYVCSFCEKRFPIKSNLDQHTRRHTGEKRFGCHICEKRFVDKIVLQKHIKSHSNFRAYKCDQCGKEYKDNKVLQVHLTKVHGIGNAKIPVRIKKYFCDACPKSYFAKNKLTRHMFSHTGEKPYVCHMCEKKFTDKSYVKQHLKSAHNVSIMQN